MKPLLEQISFVRPCF